MIMLMMMMMLMRMMMMMMMMTLKTHRIEKGSCMDDGNYHVCDDYGDYKM